MGTNTLSLPGLKPLDFDCIDIMSHLITLMIGLLIGTVAGLLIFRKNRAKLDAAEAKARDAAKLLSK